MEIKKNFQLFLSSRKVVKKKNKNIKNVKKRLKKARKSLPCRLNKNENRIYFSR